MKVAIPLTKNILAQQLMQEFKKNKKTKKQNKKKQNKTKQKKTYFWNNKFNNFK